MKKFLILYQSNIPAEQQMAKASPEQMKAGMDRWMQWTQKAGPAVIDAGMPVGHATKLTASGSRTPGGSTADGFSILQADSIDAVTKVLEGHPHFRAPGASIEVLEMMPPPGM
jgi:hypothetical protein